MPTKAQVEKEQSQPEVIVLDDDDDNDDLPQCLSTVAPRIKTPKSRRHKSDLTSKSGRTRLTHNVTIDLTASIDNLFGRKEGSRQKKADGAGEELRLMCPICMSNMKEETSTSCGHLFCKECIHTSLRHRKECPTCRKKLTINHIHRIYLSSSTM